MSLSRRKFLQTTLLTSIAGSGLLLGCSRASKQILSVPNASDASLGMWLRVGSDDQITVVVPSAEMGQGVTTSLTSIVAEELEVELDRVQVALAPANTEYNNPEMGMQGTGGSNSVLAWWEPLRKIGASARSMLVQAAAQQMQVPATECTVEDGVVKHPSGKSLRYGEVAAAAAKLEVPSEPALKASKDYRYVGKSTPRLDNRAKVTGSAQFGIDVQVPGMLYAAVRQSPVFGAEVASYDDAWARQQKGVVAVVPIPNGVAVVADSYWRARKAMLALPVTFEGGKTLGQSDASIRESFVAALDDVGKATLSGGQVIDVEYEVPYLAHATMEPMNCTADVQPNRCTVWAPTQFPGMAKGKVADLTGLDEEQVTINCTYLGGGFGRRAEQDFLVHAVLVSKAVGKPVKLIWTREEDTQHDFYRPAYLSRLQVQLGADGAPEQWEHQLAGPSILSQLTERAFDTRIISSVMGWLDWDMTSTEGTKLPYRVKDSNVDYAIVDPGVPVGFWRSVGSSHNAFTVESVMDEAAHLAGKDPLEYRLALLQDHPRHANVLKRAAEDAGWGSPLPSGHAQGLAVHESFKSIVAHVFEVSVENGAVRVHKVYSAIDCGRYVNPEIIRQQVEGSIVFGISSTLREKISIQAGQVSNSNYHDYPVARMTDSPEISVSLMENDEAPGGVGEPGVPPVAPALCNAIFAATGKRIRKLPIADQLA